MKKEFWITVGLSGLIVLFAFFLFVILRPVFIFQENQVEKNIGVVNFDKQTVGKDEIKPSELEITGNKFIQDAEILKESGFKPFFEKEEQKIKETFLERFSALIDKQILAEIKPQFDSILSGKESTEQSFAQNNPTETPKHNLTDEEWFKIAYPDYYLEYLQVLQNLMIEKGFLAASEKVEFKEEKDINPFLYKVIEFALKEKIYNQQQADSARYGIDVVLPVLQKQERIQWSKTLSILILNALKTKTAWAQGNDCYRQGVGTGSGFNGFAVCCNCGLGYWYETIVYFNDCGIASSVTCNLYEMGCKNSVCKSPKPMIWDSTTMICGCG